MPTVLSFHLHSFSCIASLKLLIFMKLRTLCNCSSVVCPPVRGNLVGYLPYRQTNKARGLSPRTGGQTVVYPFHTHQCRP